MPRRWRSARGRKGTANNIPQIGEAHLQSFDFAFPSEQPDGFGERHEPAASDELRPTTSAGERYRAKRKPELKVVIERPKSSDSVFPVSSAPRHENSQIGLAVGSPRHAPPHVFDNIAESMSPGQRHNAFLLEGPLACQSTKPKKWKIPALFRPRANSNKEPICYRFQALDAANSKKLGLPIRRTPWRNPRSPLVSQDEFQQQHALPETKHDALPAPQTDRPAPALEVSIPDTSLERYSVMFKGVNGVKQSALLLRRSKDLDSLLLVEDHYPSKVNLEVPCIVRRNTSPTTSKHFDLSSNHFIAVPASKYSLFPATPTFGKPLLQFESPSHHTRSATAPGQLSPLQSDSPARPNKLRRKPLSPSATSDAQRGPSLGATLSIPSSQADATRESAQSEIYFDVKSYRDSNGQDGQQFEMTRPPSDVVQLARSKSNARRLLQESLATGSQEQWLPDDRAIKTQSAEIDEIIAVVESFTSPAVVLGQTAQPDQAVRHHRSQSERSEETVVLAKKTKAPAKRKTRRGSSKTRLVGLNIDVPSPVIEQTEEPTPRLVPLPSSISPSPTAGLQSIDTQQPIQPSTASTPNPISRVPSPTPPSPPPPAPIIKDSKFIPLSKYAPKHVTEDLIRQTGLRPVRPQRANTDSQVQASHVPGPSSFRPPERASTMPIPQSHAKPSPPVIAGAANKASPGPAMVAYVKPAAEVSIARKVSLSRSPSARMIGSSSKFPGRTNSRARADRDQDRNRQQEKAKEAEVMERKVSLGQPVVQEVAKRHRPGRSLDIVLDTATIAPSSPPPPMPRPGEWQRDVEQGPNEPRELAPLVPQPIGVQ